MTDGQRPPQFLPPAPIPTTAPAPKRRRIPRRVRQAIEYLVSGACKTKKSAADRAGMPRETLSRWLNSVEGAEALRTRAAQEVASSAGRAAARLNHLIDSSSQKVSLDAVKYSLGVAGIKPPSENASVNIGISAGWIISVEERDEPAVKIVAGEAKPVDAKAAE